MRLLRRSLILVHRYLGIAVGLLVVMWFATGIVMMYAGGMPRLTPQVRLERLPELDLARVHLSPEEAVDRVGIPIAGRVTLVSVLGRPAYRLDDIWPLTVFADAGEILEELSLAEARTVASRFAGVSEAQVHHVETLMDVDQWTLGYGRQLPLHKFRVDDNTGTELYVSAYTGEVIVFTTRQSRALAWIGAIPHWLYFAALRVNQPLWYRTIVWTSALVCLLAVLGLVLALVQFRWRRPFRLATAIPYSGWMRWHYITGLIFGVFTVTWAFSGLLSVEPFAWTRANGLQVPRDALTGGPVDLSRFGAIDPVAWNRLLEGRVPKEVELVRIQDEHYYVIRYTAQEQTGRRERLHQPYYVTGLAEPDRLLVRADTLEIRREPFSVDSLMTRLRAALPDAPVADYELLTEYDSYYYSRGRQTPLPVLRVRFDDPGRTWVYIDPEMGQVLAQLHRYNRVERWLYNGLHSLDFAFWYNRRPLWDIGMIALLLGGLASSSIGLYLGVRRLSGRAARPAPSVDRYTPADVPRKQEAGEVISSAARRQRFTNQR